MEVITPGNEDFSQFYVLVPWMTSYSFQVMACSDVNILLARIPGRIETDYYEVRISPAGINKVEIRKNGLIKKEAILSSSMLHCSRYSIFWVSWEGGLIAVGEEYRMDSAIMLKWQDPSPHSILALHVSTANENIGRWKFSHPQGNGNCSLYSLSEVVTSCFELHA